MKAASLFLFLILGLLGCARPDYISKELLNPSSQGSCPLMFPKSSICFDITWINGPSTSGSSDFIARFWDKNTGSKDGPFIDPPGELKILLWMPSMSHGSAPVTLQKTSLGEFKVTNVYFIMPKDWEVRFTLEDQGQIFDQASFGLIL